MAVSAVGLLVVGLAAATASRADNSTGCDFAATGTTQSCSAPLTGSSFAGGDGNLLTNPTTFGTADWQGVAGLNHGIDKASGTSDNSFGQGTKEDSPSVTVVNGSIPPNKSDLTRFYEASEIGSNNHNFLYLAWERSNVLGTANMDFEINQATQPDLTTTGSKTLSRTAGDLLVTYDFTNGGGKPTLGLLTWLTAAAGNTAAQCFSSNTLPCWGNQVALNGTDSIGAVNNLDAVTDPLFPAEGNYLNPVPALQFGETAIDLTAAGVFPSGTCKAFGSTFIKSRSSTSFTAEVKDFIAPIPVNISNCGEVTIVKHTDPSGIDQNFSYDSSVPGTTTADDTSTACPTGTNAFMLNDTSSATNTYNCFNVPAGNYTVVEHQAPNFALESLTCTTGGTQHAAGSLQADITMIAGRHVTCTYVNQQQLGALKITKDSSKAAATPLAGAKFSVKDSGGTAIAGSPFTTGSDGTFCVSNLPFGTYTVTETAAPTGYHIDNPNGVAVTVNANGNCSSGTQATSTFTDTPLTDISASATSEATGGTASHITCKDSANNTVGESATGNTDPATANANGLLPGTYICTIVIDP